jgi:hypothetical protein
MGYAFGEAVMPGLEYALRTKAIRLAVAHEDSHSLLDHWDSRFEEEDQEFPHRQAEEDEECKKQMVLNSGIVEVYSDREWG